VREPAGIERCQAASSVGVKSWWREVGHALNLHVAMLQQPLIILLEQYGAD
jgi:hypothetical protein